MIKKSFRAYITGNGVMCPVQTACAVLDTKYPKRSGFGITCTGKWKCQVPLSSVLAYVKLIVSYFLFLHKVPSAAICAYYFCNPFFSSKTFFRQMILFPIPHCIFAFIFSKYQLILQAVSRTGQ